MAPNGIKNFSLYSGAKSALEGITKSLAKELAPEIRVNAIAPGAILWPEDEDLSDADQKAINQSTTRQNWLPRRYFICCSLSVISRIYNWTSNKS